MAPFRREITATDVENLGGVGGAGPNVERELARLQLKCVRCGQVGRYDVGGAIISEELLDILEFAKNPKFRAELCARFTEASEFSASAELQEVDFASLSAEQFQELLRQVFLSPASLSVYTAFENYFRCAACGSGGPWRCTEASGAVLVAGLQPENSEAVTVGEHFRIGKKGSPQSPAHHEDELRAALEASPAQASQWGALGLLLLTCGRPADAVEPLRKATELAPADGLMRLPLARALLQSGQIEESERWFREALAWAVRDRSEDAQARRHAAELALRALTQNFKRSPVDLAREFVLREPMQTSVERLTLRELDLEIPSHWRAFCDFFVNPRAARFDTRRDKPRKRRRRR
jgi:tetratricopeptide (TPR) repeat protein